MRARFEFLDLESAWHTVASIVDIMAEFHAARDRSGLEASTAYLADATAAFVRFLRMRRPHRISLGVTSDREFWKDLGPREILAIVSYEARIAGTIVDAKEELLKGVRTASQKRLSAEINKLIRESKRRVKEAKEYLNKHWPDHWEADEHISRWL
jgi:hypothetical protein